MTAWQRFRVWRRSRPFWGGLLTVLSGLEIIASMNLDLHGGTISIGQEGFPAYLIAFTLIICGPLAWFTPAQRHFYGLVATFVAIYSLIGVNLGGFFIGMLLGVIGGGLTFAWSPAATPPSNEDDTEVSPPRHAALGIVILLTISLSVVTVAQGKAAASVPCTRPPVLSPTPPPPASQPGSGGIIGDILDFLGRLLGGGSRPTTAPSPTPTPTPAPCPTSSPIGTPSPGTPGSPGPSNSPGVPGGPGSGSPTTAPGRPAIIAQDGPEVARRPGRMTGSRITMVNLHFMGVVELPTKGGGNIRVLKFALAHSDTNDFKLRVYGERGWDTELTSSKLTVKGETVFFYTNRFKANLFGLIPVDYTPESLPPPIPLPLVFFTNPDVQLVFVDSPELQAPRLRINQIRAA